MSSNQEKLERLNDNTHTAVSEKQAKLLGELEEYKDDLDLQYVKARSGIKDYSSRFIAQLKTN